MTEIFKKQQKQMDETINLLKASVKNNETMIPKIGNNNNNTISINVFLNQECKNAMNLTDFIQELNVSLEDLDYSKNNGYVAGVTNIFTKHLKDMDPKDRPIYIVMMQKDYSFILKMMISGKKILVMKR